MFLWLNSWRMSISTAKSESSCRYCSSKISTKSHKNRTCRELYTCILLHSGDEIFADQWSPRPIPIDRSLQQPTSQSPGVVPYVPENKWIKPDVLGLVWRTESNHLHFMPIQGIKTTPRWRWCYWLKTVAQWVPSELNSRSPTKWQTFAFGFPVHWLFDFPTRKKI